MVIFQIIFAGVALGIIGFVLYWFGVILKAGPDNTKDEVDKDPRLK